MRQEPTPITAGIDFSAASEAVLRHAAQGATRLGVPLIAIHVLDTGSLAFRAFRGGREADLVIQATAKVEALLARVEAAGASVEIRTGKPAEEINLSMLASGSRLLVIAANDSTKKRLGSIASRCVRSAPGDVLVVRDWQEGDFKRILVCTDFSPTSGKAFERGIFLAEVCGSALEIVHVMHPPDKDPWGEVMSHKMDAAESYEEECRRVVAEEMAKMIESNKERLSKLDFTSTVLESTSSSEALNSHARLTGADLVVLGTRGVSMIEGMFIGTNAERLLHDVGVSVLAVRD